MCYSWHLAFAMLVVSVLYCTVSWWALLYRNLMVHSGTLGAAWVCLIRLLIICCSFPKCGALQTEEDSSDGNGTFEVERARCRVRRWRFMKRTEPKDLRTWQRNQGCDASNLTKITRRRRDGDVNHSTPASFHRLQSVSISTPVLLFFWFFMSLHTSLITYFLFDPLNFVLWSSLAPSSGVIHLNHQCYLKVFFCVINAVFLFFYVKRSEVKLKKVFTFSECVLV